MKPRFYKVSHGAEFFPPTEISSSIQSDLVYVHMSTGPKGRSATSQGKDFIDVNPGDYFYLTFGNKGILLLGQFTGPANIFSNKGKGWLDRPYRLIRIAKPNIGYKGPKKWWAPNHNSTFVQIPESELSLLETHILQPFFDITLKDYGV